MWNLKNTTSEYIYKRSKLTDTDDSLVVTSGDRAVGRGGNTGIQGKGGYYGVI